MDTLNETPDTPSRPKVVILTTQGVNPPQNLEVIRQKSDVVLTDAAGLADAIPGADVLFLWDFFSTALRDVWKHADSLRWVHVAAAGVDSLLFDELRESDVVVTNAHGAFDGPIAEFVLASILAHDKQLHLSKNLQQQNVWKHREVQRTAGQNALVIGTGGIGRATARLLKAVGMNVLGAGRTMRDEDPDFNKVVPSVELAAHAEWADHLVLIAPLTQETRGILGTEVLAAMNPSAHVVNVGRGALVDEEALVQALRSGQVAAASLDVFDVEPLPADHPFWGMDNVHVSAHMSGDVVGWRGTLAQQFERNLNLWLASEPLVNQVDKKLGYVTSG
ncbi:D-2-hydroxyacid dehydrogenase [Arthrobacter oryzae]|uniref:D-2-hydroxyacid dehydrogenase n=1 Tax=Arthrobacter oryzae TaxID=409290 RepID=A0A3N0C4X1_9MICC|nr:D-2-hydroxyacid dehydrogenase [Arthrobacter oryzae]RNL57246.1 D-2-hydroxyacid dehydrogenase [Arthrobacter oryzae]